jgi:protein-S-isoprenylcysteine O-methyltransferase Ste14
MVVVHSVMLLLMAVIFLLREPLLRVHFGSSAPLAVFAALFFSGALSLGLLRARRLPVRTLVGMPEFSPGGPGELITAGIYNRIRHPRYVEAFLGVGAAALFSNYLTVYLLWAAYVPAILLVVLLEERELRERFGKPYEKYCRRVPRFVPRVGERVGSRDRAKN